MTNEQVLELCRMAFPVEDASLYGTPTLGDGKWLIGLKREHDYMPLQLDFPDCNISTNAEQYAALKELKQRIRGVLLASM